MVDAGANVAPAEQHGVAGYVSPYPYVELLQEKMDERLDRKVPATGRFCGFCFGRLREADVTCPFCANLIGDVGTEREIPQRVLKAYLTKKKTEALWVHTGAMFGLVVAAALFVVLVIWGPGVLGHPAVGFTVLIGGGYVLAQLFGTFIGAQIGYRKGAAKRDRLWGEFLAAREGDRSGAAKP